MLERMAKYKTRVFLQPVSTSSCFEEALRLCRHDNDTTRRKNKDKRNDSGDDDDEDKDAEQGGQLQHLELRAVHPSFPDPALLPHRPRPFTPTPTPTSTTTISLETITMETTSRSPSRSTLRSPSRWESVRRPVSSQRLSVPLRVQWADQQEQDLESFPRRRYDSRNPSIRYDPPRPILKQT